MFRQRAGQACSIWMIKRRMRITTALNRASPPEAKPAATYRSRRTYSFIHIANTENNKRSRVGMLVIEASWSWFEVSPFRFLPACRFL